MKGAKGFFMPRFGDAGPVILDCDLHQPRVACQRHVDMTAMLEGVVDQVGQAAFKRRGLDTHQVAARRGDAQPFRTGAARPCDAIGGIAHQRRQVGPLRILTAFAAGESEILVQHVLHLGDVGIQRFIVVVGGHHRQRQLHAGQRCLEVVADAR